MNQFKFSDRVTFIVDNKIHNGVVMKVLNNKICIEYEVGYKTLEITISNKKAIHSRFEHTREWSLAKWQNYVRSQIESQQ